jgi:hypothetical protein
MHVAEWHNIPGNKTEFTICCKRKCKDEKFLKMAWENCPSRNFEIKGGSVREGSPTVYFAPGGGGSVMSNSLKCRTYECSP